MRRNRTGKRCSPSFCCDILIAVAFLTAWTTQALAHELTSTLAHFSSETRLYALTLEDDRLAQRSDVLLVEAFFGDDAVQGLGTRDVIALSTSTYIVPATLIGQRASLDISLADGTRTCFAGEIGEAAILGSDGGFTRYRLRISAWLRRLDQARNCRVWQDKTVIEIIDAVFSAYRPLARWRWSADTGPFMARAVARSYCCQYRESDLDFVRRLLAEEGLCWRIEQAEDGPGVVLFADSSQASAVPEDPSSAFERGVRYHGAHSVEERDTVQALVEERRLHVSLTTVLGPDYKSRLVTAASSPSRIERSRRLPELESFDAPGQYAYANLEQATRYADLQMEGREARARMWSGRSTIRTLRAGTRLAVTGLPRRQTGPAPTFVVLRVLSIGVNNLPSPARDALAELFGPVPELLQELVRGDLPDDLALSVATALELGYANWFEAVPVQFPWRPQLPGSDGRSQAKPTAFGAQSAIVVGPDGRDTPNGADELYCDRLGRVRIRFHWQENGDASCWVRVAQRSSGDGMGFQFLPRIGQEVLVQFLENDIDRPVIVGALYNGQGEGGIAPTPGGRRDASHTAAVFERAHDHARSAQGNLAGGNSPVWHGASGDPGGHRNGAAQWGLRSKEFGGSGYSQLLFDDTDAQGRVQLRCTHAASELNLGHLIHTADNYRGSFRGLGAELRTDAYGAVRAGAGLLVSSYRIEHGAGRRDPAGENTAGIGLLQQAVKSVQAFNAAATKHLTVGLAAHLGASKPGMSVLSTESAPLAAMLKSASGDAHPAAPGDGKPPHMADPLIMVVARDGLGAGAGQDIQLLAGETTSLTSGQDTQFVTGGTSRIHSGQAMGVLAGAVASGKDGAGLELVSARDCVEIQAQGDEMTVQARDEINLISANAHVDWAAAKSISLSTAGGASVTIEGGNITVQCPGTLKVHAGKKSLSGPQNLNYPVPELPRSELAKRPLQFNMRLADTPGPNGHALGSTPWKIVTGEKPDGLAFVDDDRLVAEGLTDDDGNVVLTTDAQEELAAAYAAHPDGTWLVYPGHVVRIDVQTESPEWDEKQKLLQALHAADFSADLHASVLADGALPQARYAKEAFEAAATNGIFPKVKK
ncbi:type VI secretion system Vgr family protein [Massilia timonae]|uniref:type VI secretion system Vgr family protein n=1 Tax=Massilia timonae TaxID=47229 RepID=UPI0027D80A37|nr:type VI secretion system Vgr family protein [Massilia timonae]